MTISTIYVPPATNCTIGPGVNNTLVLSEPGRLNLHLYRGDSGRFTVRVQMPDGTPVDITAATWDCDVRTEPDAEPPLASLTVTPIGVTDPYSVEVIITSVDSIAIADGLATDETGVWDLQMVLDGETITILGGHVCVIDDVSRV